MRRLFNNASFQAFMMLACALCAWIDSRVGDQKWVFVQTVCACFWMFRLWGGLRAQNAGKEQS